MDEPGDNADEGGLPRAVRSQKSENAAPGNLKGDLVKCFDGLEVFGEPEAL